MTRHDVVLGDLRAIIRPGKQEDLDRFAARYTVEQSTDLRIAMKRGALRLVQKDNPFAQVHPDPEPVAEKQNNEDVMSALKDMEKRLAARLDNQVQKKSAEASLDDESIGKLNDAIAALQGIAVGGGIAPSQEEEIEIEDEKAVDIHERSINRLTQGAQSKIKSKEETGSSNAESNISELEDLL